MKNFSVIGVIVFVMASAVFAKDMNIEEGKQLTFSAQNHELDNNDNFSSDGKYLCYDTRETMGVGIDHGTTIELLELATGREIIVYKPDEIVTGDAPAPGVGAVSFNLVVPEVAFIHGPPVPEVAVRGPYGKPNRNGARVILDGDIVEKAGRWYMFTDGKYNFSWIDKRDIATDRDTLSGAHRGGTHRHEYSGDGRRIGFTYDDFLLPEYDRTVGYMQANTAAPDPASHYFAVIVPVVPKGTSKPGEIEKAYGDSWVDAAGTMRAFIGVVRNDDRETYEESLFVADIPVEVDITTADSGNAERYPTPPEGITIRRLTHEWAGGIVRGAPDGKRIAYYGKDENGLGQIFTIEADGSDRHENPAKRPLQVTFLPEGTEAGLRWHPDGNHILCLSDGGLVMTDITPGNNFGKYRFITPHGDGNERYAPVISVDGKQAAYNCLTPTFDEKGTRVLNYADLDFSQIFVVAIDL
jgi:hypothetical protein